MIQHVNEFVKQYQIFLIHFLKIIVGIGFKNKIDIIIFFQCTCMYLN